MEDLLNQLEEVIEQERFSVAVPFRETLPQMTTRSNAPASLKRWDKSGYVTVLTSYPMANRHYTPTEVGAKWR
jgi:hypothetical protein